MRLVDADALIDRLNERKSREQGIRNIADILRVKSFIEEQPTAYDIDKVVEELEEKKQNALEVEESIKEYNVWNDAIEIVKQGSVADNVMAE